MHWFEAPAISVRFRGVAPVTGSFMNRRDFVASIAAGTGLLGVAQANPCPPAFEGSNPNCPPPTGGILASAASQLAGGQYALDPIPWNPNNIRYDISQQCVSSFWDDTRKELHYMGKVQNGGNTHHFIYNETANQWSWPGQNVDDANALGHIWIATFDNYVHPGRYYHVGHYPNQWSPDGTRNVAYYDPQTRSWTRTPNAPHNLWSNSGTPNPGLIVHPNLFGNGRAGLATFGTGSGAGYSAFEFATQEWRLVNDYSFYSSPYADSRYAGNGIYLPDLDEAILGTGSQHRRSTVIKAGDAFNPNPEQRTAPINITGGAFGRNGAHMIVDPRNPGSGTMLLERRGSRVWSSNNAGRSWVQESFSHPFWNNNPYKDPNDEGSWTPASIGEYGVILGMSSYVAPGGSLLWRPPA